MTRLARSFAPWPGCAVSPPGAEVKKSAPRTVVGLTYESPKIIGIWSPLSAICRNVAHEPASDDFTDQPVVRLWLGTAVRSAFQRLPTQEGPRRDSINQHVKQNMQTHPCDHQLLPRYCGRSSLVWTFLNTWNVDAALTQGSNQASRFKFLVIFDGETAECAVTSNINDARYHR